MSSPSPVNDEQHKQHVFNLLCVVFFAASLLWDGSGLDQTVSQLFGSAQGFALRNDWFLTRVMHDGARRFAWLLLGVMICIAVFARQHGLRNSARWAVAGTLTAILVVQWLKWISATSCPWDLHLFGGQAGFVSHWNWRITDRGPGRCFPAGHASTGFALLPAWVALHKHMRHPLLVLGMVVVVGLALGMVQVLRGAHFVSHVLWSGSACLLVAWVAGVLRKRFTRHEALN
jgi:membrane-associated PAP2 superfamily phosphatase